MVNTEKVGGHPLNVQPVARGDMSALAQSVIRTYGEHNVAALSALYAADAMLVFPGAVFAGRDEINGMWHAWFDAFPDVASQTHRIWDRGRRFRARVDRTGHAQWRVRRRRHAHPGDRPEIGMDGCQPLRGGRRRDPCGAVLHRSCSADARPRRCLTTGALSEMTVRLPPPE